MPPSPTPDASTRAKPIASTSTSTRTSKHPGNMIIYRICQSWYLPPSSAARGVWMLDNVRVSMARRGQRSMAYVFKLKQILSGGGSRPSSSRRDQANSKYLPICFGLSVQRAVNVHQYMIPRRTDAAEAESGPPRITQVRTVPWIRIQTSSPRCSIILGRRVNTAAAENALHIFPRRQRDIPRRATNTISGRLNAWWGTYNGASAEMGGRVAWGDPPRHGQCSGYQTSTMWFYSEVTYATRPPLIENPRAGFGPTERKLSVRTLPPPTRRDPGSGIPKDQLPRTTEDGVNFGCKEGKYFHGRICRRQ
ncbi:hypothetical protein DFH09DRAFT_1078833 [Mycena vulgaris]|nr:hypothetical protein DFH09DRAFT_1078833 [Mycena vulgaris]